MSFQSWKQPLLLSPRQSHLSGVFTFCPQNLFRAASKRTLFGTVHGTVWNGSALSYQPCPSCRSPGSLSPSHSTQCVCSRILGAWQPLQLQEFVKVPKKLSSIYPEKCLFQVLDSHEIPLAFPCPSHSLPQRHKSLL